VYLVASGSKQSLLDFKYKPKFEAERGEHGLGQDCFGRGGEDLILEVPPGTLVYDEDEHELLGDLVHPGDKILIAPGGKGGRGNLSFKSSTNRAPKTATPGEPGVSRTIRLELKLLADVGLLGLPNAGKSSFLSAVSRARPKVADYPFTTLEPHLGVVPHKDKSIIIADLPGLIEGASEGAGLGHKFLKHVARNRLFLHLVEVTADDIPERIKTIRKELKAYDKELARREEWLVFTKIDLLPEEELEQKKAELKKQKLDGFFVSSKTGKGLEPLLNKLAEEAAHWKVAEPELDAEEVRETPMPVPIQVILRGEDLH
jgi:GTP-binding protein